MLFYGCSTQKDNATNRSLQNLSARYNLIYNSNVLLAAYQEELAFNNKDNYENFLDIYIAPPTIDNLSSSTPTASSKLLDEISLKAQTIIAEKGLSNYVGEAYLLLAKTNFYKGNYFTAAAYFDYTQKAYSSNHNITLNAATWKARSLMQLKSFKQADAVLDTVNNLLDSAKKDKAESFATLAQMNIYKQDIKKAIQHLEEAIKTSSIAQQKIRWSYILAQLYEHEKQYAASLDHYTKVEKSNAPFEMYFNAKLSKIRINDALSNQTSDRKQQLLKLLKDDKNFDYIDQIYYEVAQDYLARQEYDKAEEYYKLSTQKSVNNLNQKGLTYLRLADLNFKNLGNYVNAKLYYDSASATLPKNYPNYDAIVKKSQNLAYLTQRYQLIAKQDSLQTLARLSPQDREQKITEMFTVTKKIEQPVNNIKTNISNAQGNDQSKSQSGSTFYFGNVGAIAKGFTDFKKRWGNRALADDWRQSVKSSAQANQQSQNNVIINGTNGANATQTNIDNDRAAQIAAYTSLLPLTPEKITLSNQDIIDAYYEIGSFYQQVLEDHEEAVKVYETAIKRYPKNNKLDAMYYSLYLGYAGKNKEKSETFKRLVLTDFPTSIYAKAILDPNFSAKQNAIDIVVNKNYNTIFTSYEKKDFPSVISSVNDAIKLYPGNNLQAQYDYLKAIAIGRTQNVDSLLTAFNHIILKYPNDNLINPLVKDHLAYINANLSTFKSRKIALVDFDPTEPRFIAQQDIPAVQQDQPKVNPTVIAPKPVAANPIVNQGVANSTNLNIQPAANQPVVKSDPSINAQPVVDNLFSKLESKTYYYVISVSDMSMSLSSSRFGVGQFNRVNYAGTGLKHQLYELEEDQLIFVGNFKTVEDVKIYSEGITPQLQKIMKVPSGAYKGFYISQENFDKIKNRETLNRYLEFFKNNY
jgi:tetratricopeptide (TPR) repeat protein